jgi:Uncharacterized conserved protein
MGSSRCEFGRRSNEVQRSVELQWPFYIGLREVVNAEFRQFCPQHVSGIYKDEMLDLDRQLVVRIGWQVAAVFCNWLSEKDGLSPVYVQKNEHLKLTQPMTTNYRLPTKTE